MADACTRVTGSKLFCQRILLANNTSALRGHAQTTVGEIQAGQHSPTSIAREAQQQH